MELREKILKRCDNAIAEIEKMELSREKKGIPKNP